MGHEVIMLNATYKKVSGIWENKLKQEFAEKTICWKLILDHLNELMFFTILPEGLNFPFYLFIFKLKIDYLLLL